LVLVAVTIVKQALQGAPDPSTSGVCRQHADAQQQPEFGGRPAGGSQADQLPSLGRQGGQDDGSSRAISYST